MDVKCPRCRAEYEIDPSLVQKGPVRLQCAACSCTFRLQLAGSTGSADWRVRQREDGTILELDGLTTLQRWIVERKVSRDDEISKSGKQWKRLGDMAELSSFFMVVDQLDQMASSTQAALEESPAPAPLTKSAAISAALKQSATPEPPSLDSSIEEALDALDAESPDLASGFEEDLASELLDAFDGVQQEEDGEGEKDELADALLASLAVSGFYRVPSGLQEQLESAHREAMEVDRKEAELRASQPVVEVVPPSPSANPVAQPIDDSDPVVTLTPKAAPKEDAVVVVSDEPEPKPKPEPAPTPEPTPAPAAESEWFDGAANDELEYQPGSSNTVIFAAVGLVLVLGVIAFVIFGSSDDKSSEAAQANPEGEASAEGATDPAENSDPSDDEGTSDESTSDAGAQDNTGTDNAGAASSSGDTLPTLLPTDIAPDMLVGASYAITSQRLAVVLDPDGGEEEEAAAESGTKKKRLSFDGAMRKAKKARERGKYKAALDAYRVALDRRSNNLEAITGMGWSYISLKKYDAAIAEFKRALSHSSRYSVAYIGLGKAYQSKSDYKSALKAYETYLEINSSGSQASIARAQAEKLRRKLGGSSSTSKDSGSTSKDSGSTSKDSGTTSKDSGSTSKDSGGSDDDSTSTSTDSGKKVIIKKKDDDDTQQSGGGKKVIIKKKP